MHISLVAAMAKHRVIGLHNRLPWHLPADLAHFKAVTIGKPIIMGRKTFESIGKALPGRRNIIVSRNHHFEASECEVYKSLEAAVAAVSDYEEVCIIGGGEIFRQALKIADCMYLTLIHHAFDGDAYFPAWNDAEWKEVERKAYEPDEHNRYRYSFV